ncbi:MAG: SnoaL-like domain-containing protein [Hamadaea sp.]|nr:SnoaL-like domain-containing protein [Hamadaea sp.]
MDNRQIVAAAAKELFGDKDPTAVDRWVSPTYKQHSTVAADGPEGLRSLIESISPDVRFEVARVLADDDHVAMHGTYYGFGPEPLVAFEIFRVEDGKLAEHWDGLTPQVAQTVSGRTQTDGPAQVTHPEQTEASRALVTEFADKVLVGQDYGALIDYISAERYDQHNPEAADGLDGFGAAAAAWAEQGKNLDYRTVHKVIADGEFVLLQSEGTFGVPVAYYDLFRVDDGKIVEHWDAVVPVPAKLNHSNGVF